MTTIIGRKERGVPTERRICLDQIVCIKDPYLKLQKQLLIINVVLKNEDYINNSVIRGKSQARNKSSQKQKMAQATT